MLTHFPEAGKISADAPLSLYTWHVRGTERNFPLIFFYTFGNGTVILMGVKATTDPDEE